MATTDEIKTLWARVDELEKQVDDLTNAFEDKRWQLAEMLYGASRQGGGTQDQKTLAKEIGRSPAHVSQYIKIWRWHKDKPEGYRPRFSEVFAEAKQGDEKPGRAQPGGRDTAKRPRGKSGKKASSGLPAVNPTAESESEPTTIAEAFTAIWRLTESDPKEVAESVAESEYPDQLKWAADVTAWIKTLVEAIHVRFGIILDDDDSTP